MALVKRVYEVTRDSPADERFGLISETRKSARSVPYNISEGKMRLSPSDCRRFISIALGSLGELHTQVLTAGMLGFLPVPTVASLETEIDEIGRMLRGLERALG